MIYHIDHIFKQKISCSTTLDNLLKVEKKYFKQMKKIYTNIHFIHNKQSFILDIDNNKFFNVKSHSYIIFPKQSKNHILLVHGTNSGPSIWFETAVFLAEQGYIVHCISLPGFGGSIVSDKLLDFTSIEILTFYSNYIAEYIVNNIGKNNPPQIVAHSLGSYIISFFASKYPNLCKSNTIINGCVLNIFGKDMFYWGLFFKWGLPNSYAKNIGYIINYLLFTYYYFLYENHLLSYIQILEMTCRENIGERIFSKLIHYDNDKLKMDVDVFSYMLTTKDYPPISIICGENDPMLPIHCSEFLSNFFIEKNDIIKISSGHNPISHPDFSSYLFQAIQNTTKLKYLDKMDELVEISNQAYSTSSLTKTEEIIQNTYRLFLLLLEKNE